MLRNGSSVALTVMSVVLFSSAFALAAPRDKAADKKIQEAMYTNFLNTDFDGAEGLLLGTIRACEDKCSPGVVAKAWMYIGVVRGVGRSDMSGAQEAFTTAVSTDSSIALDNDVANDPVKALWAKVKGSGASAPAPSHPKQAAAPAAAAFTCTPALTEIETRRPVPMQCESDAELSSAVIHYKDRSGDGGWSHPVRRWNKTSPEAWRGTIPCSATQNTGSLKFSTSRVWTPTTAGRRRRSATRASRAPPTSCLKRAPIRRLIPTKRRRPDAVSLNDTGRLRPATGSGRFDADSCGGARRALGGAPTTAAPEGLSCTSWHA